MLLSLPWEVVWRKGLLMDFVRGVLGRTGRAGKTGVAITFLNDGDEELMYVSPSPLH